MKKGITVEFDYSDDGLWIRKAKGSLNIEEIAAAVNEYWGEDRYFMMIDTEAPDGFYDEGLFNEFVPKGDTVKVYGFDALKRLFGGK